MPRTLMFTGGCNRAVPYFATSNATGIEVHLLDEDTGEAERTAVYEGIDNPTYLTVSADGKQLFASSEVLGWNEGTVTVYDIDRENAALVYVNKVPSRGDIAAFVDLDHTDRFVACCNYSVLPVTEQPNASVAVFERRSNGELSPVICEVRHEGTGPNPERQERPHAHGIRFTHDNRFALVADLGIDRVMIYAFDENSGALTPHGEVVLPPGSGPRHIAMHPTKPFAYVVNELNSTVATLQLEGNGGAACINIDRTVPEEALSINHCSAIKVSPDSRHLYVGNRGHESFGVFAIDPDSAIASHVGSPPCGGVHPRDLGFTPSGKLLAVCNQDSDRILFFSRDASNGALTQVGPGVETGTPTCAVFVA